MEDLTIHIITNKELSVWIKFATKLALIANDKKKFIENRIESSPDYKNAFDHFIDCLRIEITTGTAAMVPENADAHLQVTFERAVRLLADYSVFFTDIALFFS